MVPVCPTARLGSAPPDCGQWVIPEWERVADECDVAHFTILVYLSSATRALQVDLHTVRDAEQLLRAESDER